MIATDSKATRCTLRTLVLVISYVLIANPDFAGAHHSETNGGEVCSPSPSGINYLGPELTVAQVEQASVERLGDSNAPKVPFGYQNSKWIELKALMHSGDTIHAYSTGMSGGHLVLRGSCFVGGITSWAR